MQSYTVGSRPHVEINGKDFAVFRHFAVNTWTPIFLQVAGRTPLRKEDLDGKDWTVVTTGGKAGRAYTAWRQTFFDEESDKGRDIAFVGASTAGSLFLAIRYLARRFDLEHAEADLAGAARRLLGPDLPLSTVFTRLADRGATEESAILIEHPGSLDREWVVSLLGDLPSTE